MTFAINGLSLYHHSQRKDELGGRKMLKSNMTKKKVLKVLLKREGDIVSGSELSSLLKVSRQTIWKAIESLREEGFYIESIPHQGYRLLDKSNADLSPTWIELSLDDISWGHPVLYWDSLDSTQEPAKSLARQGANEGIVILAEEQKAGRGRLGREWLSPEEGSISLSVISRPNIDPSFLQLLSLSTAIAVHDCLKELFNNIDLELKWPNDILWKGAKICGILIEASSEPGKVHYAIIGIGLNANLNQKTLSTVNKPATSLKTILGRKVHRGKIVAALVRQLQKEISNLEKREGITECIRKYSKLCSTLGMQVKIEQDNQVIKGIAEGISPLGNLIVRSEKGTMMSFSAADVTHLKAIKP